MTLGVMAHRLKYTGSKQRTDDGNSHQQNFPCKGLFYPDHAKPASLGCAAFVTYQFVITK